MAAFFFAVLFLIPSISALVMRFLPLSSFCVSLFKLTVIFSGLSAALLLRYMKASGRASRSQTVLTAAALLVMIIMILDQNMSPDMQASAARICQVATVLDCAALAARTYLSFRK